MSSKKLPPKTTIQKFRQLTDALGPKRFAQLAGVAPSTISHLRAGRTRPSLALATVIERLSHGTIVASAWEAAA